MNRSTPGPVAEALRIEWSARVRRQAHQEIAASLAPGQPRRAAQLRQLLAQRDFVAEFEQRFGGYGLRPDSLDDVTTAHWLTLWTVVHDAPFPEAARVRTVREQLARAWSGTRVPRDARARQLLAETMLVEMSFALEQQAQRRAAGDSAGLAQMARNTAQSMRTKRGIDLEALRITEAGITPMQR